MRRTSLNVHRTPHKLGPRLPAFNPSNERRHLGYYRGGQQGGMVDRFLVASSICFPSGTFSTEGGVLRKQGPGHGM